MTKRIVTPSGFPGRHTSPFNERLHSAIKARILRVPN